MLNEADVQKALGVNSLDELGSGDVKNLLALIPEMDPELAQGILTSPGFQVLVGNMLTSVSEDYKGALASNDSGHALFHERWMQEFKLYSDQLENADLSPKERASIFDGLARLSQQSFSADSENKKFLNGLFDKATAGKVLVVASVVVVAVAAATAVVTKSSGSSGLTK
ncbi:MAG: hypothetical protein RL719_1007 [Actinomycetota bacterium]|jgi:hypothetical protein